MERALPTPRRRISVLLLALPLIAAALCWRFPLFHVVSIEEARRRQPVAFDAGAVARAFWEAKLLPASGQALELRELSAALVKDAAAARKQFGRSVGLSSTTAVFVKGSGRVTGIDEDVVRVALAGGADGTEVQLVTGLVFGNAVRDATGLLDVSAYADSQDFNNLSTELNRIVETAIAPELRAQARLAREIRFVGCLELEEDADPARLQIVPVKIEWP